MFYICIIFVKWIWRYRTIVQSTIFCSFEISHAAFYISNMRVVKNRQSLFPSVEAYISINDRWSVPPRSYFEQDIFDKAGGAGKRGWWIDEIVSRPHQFHILKPRNFRVLTSIPWCRFFIFHTVPVPLTTCCAGSLSISRRKNSNSLIRR